jgi:hypothetical protein
MEPGADSGADTGCPFMCSDGTCIDAAIVCNQRPDCADGSDERPEICDTPGACCVATMGCPGETGSSCAETCCCCPANQRCCEDPTLGCCVDQ